MKRIFVSLLFFAAIVSCKKNEKKQDVENTQQTQQTPQTSTEKHFEKVQIPSVIISQQERADYKCEHYWDNFNFSDTSYINLPDVTEQAYVDYIGTLTNIETPQAAQYMAQLMTKTEVDTAMHAYFVKLNNIYLFDPNSPYRNEEFFIPVLQNVIQYKYTNEGDKARAEYNLKMLNKNRVGQKTANITYTLASGATGQLYNIKSEYTLLFFNNPGCHACREYIEYIGASQILKKMMEDKRLTIIAVYPDEDLKAWHEYLPNMPKNWILSYDKTKRVKNNDTYFLKAIPSLYLLDKDKKVILKDTKPQNVEQYFIKILQQQ